MGCRTRGVITTGNLSPSFIYAIRPDMAGMSPAWVVYFGVADVHASAAKVQALGGTVLNGPIEMAGYPFATCQDPQGAMFFILGQPAA
jgi:predicted enzyme related to lactoylglutathione lyase